MQKTIEEDLTKIRDHKHESGEWRSVKDLEFANKPPELPAWRHYKWRYLISAWMLIGAAIAYKIDSWILGVGPHSIYLWIIMFPLTLLAILFPTFACYTYVRAVMLEPNHGAQDVEKFVEFTNPKARTYFGNPRKLDKKIPIETLYEAYFDEEIDFKQDLLDTLEHAHYFACYRFTWNHFKFFFTNFVPEVIIHSRAQDRAQVQDHYNRGNDFFRSFLGRTMVYTCASFMDRSDTLEEAQIRKLHMVCRKTHMAPGRTHLDLGCGWGTLVAHAARYYGTKSVGITLAKEQVKWGENQANNQLPYKERPKGASTKFYVCDYRDRHVYAPHGQRFHAITALEMSEHVGVRKFQTFLRQVYDMLEDDGIFYMQFAGLRRAFVLHDLIWGLFMNKYIFPGADASSPIHVVTSELTSAGFEVHSIENMNVHYSMTIYRWYLNWIENKKYITERYGERWYRLWYFFLAWSTMTARRGGGGLFQIISHKNVSSFDRSRFIGEHNRKNFWISREELKETGQIE